MNNLHEEVQTQLGRLDDLWTQVGLFCSEETLRTGQEEDRASAEATLRSEVLAPILARIRLLEDHQRDLRQQIYQLSQQAERLNFSLADSRTVPDAVPLREAIGEWKKVINSLTTLRDQRRSEVLQLRTQMEPFCRELGDSPEHLFPDLVTTVSFLPDPPPDSHGQAPPEAEDLEDLSSTRVAQWKEALTSAQDQVNQLRGKIKQMKAEVRSLWEDLEWTAEQRAKHPVDVFVGPTDGTDDKAYHFYSQKNQQFYSMNKSLDLVTQRRDELMRAYQRLHGAVNELLPKICTLWKELQVPTSDPHRVRLWEVLLRKKNSTSEERKAFLAQVMSNNSQRRFPLSTIEACEKEYERLNKIKEAAMKKLIDKARQDLHHAWDKLHFSDSQRREFAPAYSEEYTQETLDAILAEIERLRGLWTTMGALLKQIERREWIKSEMYRFEETASDPDRFKGSSTRLLEEEKFRKIVAKEFPRLTTSLRKSLTQWQREHGGEAFYYEGVPYLDTMNEEEENPNFELLHLRLLTQNSGGRTPAPATPTAATTRTASVRSAAKPKPVPIDPTTASTSRAKTTGRRTAAGSRPTSDSSTPLRSSKPVPRT